MAQIQAQTIINTITNGININPTTIELNIKEKQKVNGALKNVITKRNIKVCIYFNDTSVLEEHKAKETTSYLSYKMKMIADKDADILVTPSKEYTFIHPVSGEKYKIDGSYPYIVQNTICGYQCDLLRLD